MATPTTAESKALSALKTAEAKFLELKAESYNAQVNSAYNKLAVDTKAAHDGLKAEIDARS